MRLIYPIIFFILVLPGAFKEASASNYKLSRTKEGYNLKANLFINASMECAIDTIYDFKHLKSFTKRVNSVELLHQDGNLQEVRFFYKNLFFEAESIYYRKLIREENKIIFELKEHRYQGIFLPHVISSKGYYSFTVKKEGCLVEYFEECKLENTRLKWFYAFLAKKSIDTFFRDIKEYVESVCKEED